MGLVRPGGSPRRHPSPAYGTGFQHHVDLDGRVATGIKDFSGDDVGNGGHGGGLNLHRPGLGHSVDFEKGFDDIG